MSHTILSLQQQLFSTRVALGGCMININGETMDCLVDADNSNFTNPTFTVKNKETGAELCTFRPYHIHAGPVMYQIEGVSQSGGDGMLIVPEHGILDKDIDELDYEPE